MKKKTTTAKNNKTNAIDMLESQHREVEELFEEFETATEEDEDSDKASSIALLVCAKLTMHATIEEELFYPAVQADETEDLLAESTVEHMSAKRLIADIATVGDDGKQLKALMTVLQEQIQHHVDEEEETLFPQAKELISSEELVDLAIQMQDRLEELMAAQAADADEDEDDAAGPNDGDEEDEANIAVAPPKKNAARASKTL